MPLPAAAGRIAEILGIAAPQPRLVGRAQRHHQIALELHPRSAQPPRTLHQKGTDRLGGPPQLRGDPTILLDIRPPQTRPMQLERQGIGTPKDHKVIDVTHRRLLLITDH